MSAAEPSAVAVDTSIAVAAFAAWHVRHDHARTLMARRPLIAAHSLLETYSVLTRLPAPLRVAPEPVRDFLADRFAPELRMILPAEDQAHAVERLIELGVSGGAVYDGLIALTAAAAGTELLTLDGRALPTYRRCGADARLVD